MYQVDNLLLINDKIVYPSLFALLSFLSSKGAFFHLFATLNIESNRDKIIT